MFWLSFWYVICLASPLLFMEAEEGSPWNISIEANYIKHTTEVHANLWNWYWNTFSHKTIWFDPYAYLDQLLTESGALHNKHCPSRLAFASCCADNIDFAPLPPLWSFSLRFWVMSYVVLLAYIALGLNMSSVQPFRVGLAVGWRDQDRCNHLTSLRCIAP